jgi:hypothetical protein
LIYTGDFSPEELETYKTLTIINVLQATQQILVYAVKNKVEDVKTE